jgi:cytochrome P450
MPHSQVQLDPELYLDPLEFNPLRFFDIRQKQGESDKHQFASNSSTNPAWGIGKYACPGRFWAGAQIKLLLMVLLLEYDIAFPVGQTKKPGRVAIGGSFKTSVTQTCVLKRRASATKGEK